MAGLRISPSCLYQPLLLFAKEPSLFHPLYRLICISDVTNSPFKGRFSYVVYLGLEGTDVLDPFELQVYWISLNDSFGSGQEAQLGG